MEQRALREGERRGGEQEGREVQLHHVPLILEDGEAVVQQQVRVVAAAVAVVYLSPRRVTVLARGEEAEQPVAVLVEVVPAPQWSSAPPMVITWHECAHALIWQSEGTDALGLHVSVVEAVGHGHQR